MKELFGKIKSFMNVKISIITACMMTLFICVQVQAQDGVKESGELLVFLSENKAVLLGFLLALSEVLSLVESVKANGVFQLITSLIKKIAEFFGVKK